MTKVNYRKYALCTILIYLIAIILLKYLQLTRICEKTVGGDKIRVNKRLIVGSGATNFGQKIQNGVVFAIFKSNSAESEQVLGLKPDQMIVIEGIAMRKNAKDLHTDRHDVGEGVHFDAILARLTSSLYCNIELIDPSIVEISKDTNLGFYLIRVISNKMLDLQRFLLGKIAISLPPIESSLMAGILLGVNQSIPVKIHDDFVNTGLLHVVAASGYNIQIVAETLLIFFHRVFKKRLGYIFTIMGIGGYVVLAGASPAVLRAGLMGILIILSKMSGRVYEAKWALIISMLILLLCSPLLLWNVSFQLSVAATVGILWFQPLFRCDQPKNADKHSSSFMTAVKEEFASAWWTTVSASLLTFPILFYWFGQVSVISFFANSVLLWMIPWLMGIGGVFLIISMISTPLANVVAIPFVVVSRFFLWANHLFASVPFGHFQFPISTLSFMFVAMWYGAVFVLYKFLLKRK